MNEELFVPPSLGEEEKPSTDFTEWCRKSGNLMPTPEMAWDAQVSYISSLEYKLVQSVEMLKKSRETIEDLKKSLLDLKNMFEENLMLMSELEIENMMLKDKVNE